MKNIFLNIVFRLVGRSELRLGVILAALAVTATGCEEYLDTTNENVYPAHEALQSIGDLQETTAYLYCAPWYYFHKQRFVQMSDCRANNIYTGSTSNAFSLMSTFGEANDNTVLSHAWGSLYNVLAQASYILNDYIPYCEEQSIGTDDERNVCRAECYFMQALAYWHLAMFWHDVPIIDDPVNAPANARANRFEDVLLYAILRAEQASKWLPNRPYQIGRVSRVSTLGLLSRLYLTAADYARGGHFTDAFLERVLRPHYATDVTWRSTPSLSDFFYAKAEDAATSCLTRAANSGYALMDDYEEMFRVQNNNCREVLFALQFVQGATSYGICNDQQGTYCYDRCLDDNWGVGYLRASYDFIYDAIRRGGLSRTRGNIMPSYMTYDYLYHELDTCAQQGKTWTCGNMSSLPIKKQVVGGPMATQNLGTKDNSAFCTPMLRLAEVYLNLTEAKMGLAGVTSTTDADILWGVNQVRRRAYKSEIAEGIYRGDYGETGPFTPDSMLIERRMEFFCEGLCWQDIVRRSFRSEADLTHMLRYANNQLIEMENDSIMGCHRLYSYRYTGNAKNTARLGSVALTKSSSGAYTVSRTSKTVVHNVGEGSWCHASVVGEEDNLWSVIYPPSESLQAPALLLEPIGYDFQLEE